MYVKKTKLEPDVPTITEKMVIQYFVEVKGTAPVQHIRKGPFGTRQEAESFLKQFEKQWYRPAA